MGPWIVHHSAIAKPDQLDIVTKVNGEIRQQSNTKHFIFSIEHIISTLSQGMTLLSREISLQQGRQQGLDKDLSHRNI